MALYKYKEEIKIKGVKSIKERRHTKYMNNDCTFRLAYPEVHIKTRKFLRQKKTVQR